MSLVKVENLSKNFSIKKSLFGKTTLTVNAVNNVSFAIKKGQTLGLVGESGCGKSTLGRCVIRLLNPTSGKVFFNKNEITNSSGSDLREYRKKMQIVFQDPFASLNPRMTVSAILEEPLIIHKLYDSKNERSNRILELLDLVGLKKEHGQRYPHEFSGGQRQRIGIARALAVSPEFIVCDEPVSALDVSIQAQVINLLMDLQQKLELTYLFIAHDLKVVEHVSNQVAVMYLGQIVEMTSSAELYKNPQHPYTKALLSAIPIPKPGQKERRTILTGDVPNPINPPSGCTFHTRCPLADENCKKQKPLLQETNKDHWVSCFKV